VADPPLRHKAGSSIAFAVGNLVTHGYASDGEDAAYKAITAGLNMDMASLTYTLNLAR
jgi:beta-glucosidase